MDATLGSPALQCTAFPFLLLGEWRSQGIAIHGENDTVNSGPEPLQQTQPIAGGPGFGIRYCVFIHPDLFRSCRHSADVKMSLLIDGTSLPVAQLGPDFLLLKTPLDHPPHDATIVLRVDGNER